MDQPQLLKLLTYLCFLWSSSQPQKTQSRRLVIPFKISKEANQTFYLKIQLNLSQSVCCFSFANKCLCHEIKFFDALKENTKTVKEGTDRTRMNDAILRVLATFLVHVSEDGDGCNRNISNSRDTVRIGNVTCHWAIGCFDKKNSKKRRNSSFQSPCSLICLRHHHTTRHGNTHRTPRGCAVCHFTNCSARRICYLVKDKNNLHKKGSLKESIQLFLLCDENHGFRDNNTTNLRCLFKLSVSPQHTRLFRSFTYYEPMKSRNKEHNWKYYALISKPHLEQMTTIAVIFPTREDGLKIKHAHKRHIRSSKCPNGSFSEDCDRNCHCANRADCELYNGSCSDSLCMLGWKGSACNERFCDPEKFGPLLDSHRYQLIPEGPCVEDCHCQKGSECHVITGECLQECNNKSACDFEFCSRGHFSPKTSCSEVCNCWDDEPCHPVSGVCLKGICHGLYIPPTCSVSLDGGNMYFMWFYSHAFVTLAIVLIKIKGSPFI